MKYTPAIHGLFLFILTLSVYSNSFYGDFVFDDRMFILNNTGIRNIFDVQTIWNLLGYPARFIAFYSFALNYHCHQYDVFGYHLVNVVIHVFNVFCVYGIVSALLKIPHRHLRVGRRQATLALIAAMIFAVHPLQTQAVSYITQRFASLATLFYLLAIWSYLQARLSGRGRWFLATAVSGLLGMFTKQIVMTLPLMILLMEWCFFKKSLTDHTSEIRPLSPVVVCIAGLSFLIVPAFFNFNVTGMLAMSTESGSHAGDVITSWSYFLSQPRVVWTYIRLAFVPIGQNLDYDFPISPSLGHGPTGVGVLGVLVLMTFAMRWRHNNPLLAFGILWFFTALSVESGVIPIKHLIFEHRCYLPMFGFSLVFATLLVQNIHKDKILQLSVLLIIAMLSVLTFQRNRVWSDDISLWTDVLKKSPNKSRPYESLGIAHLQRGEHLKALTYFDEALSRNPQSEKAYNNRGLLYHKLGRLDEAIADYNATLTINPNEASAYNNRGNVYSEKGLFSEALDDYNKSLELRNPYPDAWLNRGIVLGRQQQYSEALQSFDAVLKYDSQSVEAYNNRGVVYNELGEYSRAIEDLTQAIRLRPEDAFAYFNRAIAYQKSLDFDRALADLDRAIQHRHDYSEAYNNRGILLGFLNHNDRALKAFDQAIDLNPDFSSAYFNRSLAHSSLGNHHDALKDALKSRQLGKDIANVYITHLKDQIQTLD